MLLLSSKQYKGILETRNIEIVILEMLSNVRDFKFTETYSITIIKYTYYQGF